MTDALTVALVALVLSLAILARRVGQLHWCRWISAHLAPRRSDDDPRPALTTPTFSVSFSTSPHTGGFA